MSAVQLSPTMSFPIVAHRHALRPEPAGIEKDHPTTPTDRDKRSVAAAAAASVDHDQENDDFNCRYFSASIAINAVHTWVLTALALVPTKVLTLHTCLSALPLDRPSFEYGKNH